LRRRSVEDLIRHRRGVEHGDAKLTDLLVTLADCPKARSVSVYDRCKAVYEGCESDSHLGQNRPFCEDALTSSSSTESTQRSHSTLRRSHKSLAPFVAIMQDRVV
jgi:hypothetical protein